MKINKLSLPSNSSSFLRETVYRVQDGETVTFIHETIYDGPCSESDDDTEWTEAIKPNFRMLKPEEVEASPELLSFMEAVSKGEQDSHPRSSTRFDHEYIPRGRRY